MTTLKNLKGTAIQFLDADPVVYAGSWSSGGSLNTARTALQSSGTGTDNAIVGGGYNASSSPSRVQSEQYNGTAWTETNNINNSRMFGSGAGTATAAIISGGDPGGYTETWDGSSWSEVAEMNTARNQQQNIGTVPSALAIGGGNPSAVTNVESWNGSAWTETATDLNTAKKYVVGTGIVTACLVTGTPATTEQFNGSSWTEIAESNTDHRSGAASGIVTDALFYGGDNGPGYVSKTETWNGSAWTEVSDLATGTSYLGGTQNSSSGNTNSLAFGGGTPSQTTATEEWSFPPPTASALQEGDMWFNSSSSTLKGYGTAAGIPVGTWASGGSLNTARRGLGGAGIQTAGLGFAGYSTTVLAITESYNGTSWTEVNDLNTARQILGSAGTVNTASLGFGGDINPPVGTATANTELWNGSSWTEVNNLNTARKNLKGFGTSSAAIAAAGEPNSALVENWDGTSWTETTEINTGRQSIGAAGISNTAGIIFGGGGPEGETETWNGSSWTEVSDLNTGRRSLSGSGDSSNALAMGGITTTDQAVVEAWNGSSWTEIADLATGRGDAGSSHGAGNTTALFFGGDNPPIANTEEFTASAAVTTVTTS